LIRRKCPQITSAGLILPRRGAMSPGMKAYS
jgi:hypothetical protein